MVRKFKIILLLSLLGLGVIWYLERPDGRIRVIFCDVNQGDGILITKNYFQMIIDTGPDNGKMGECLSRYLPFWDRQIEVAVITHEDADHSGGLKRIGQSYQIKKLFNGDLRRGEVVRFEDIDFLVLSPEEKSGDSNADSTVGLLTAGGRDFLLLADIPAEAEQRLVWRQILTGPADVLKVSHHGSAEATSIELLEVIKPAEAVISVGKSNRFGHPVRAVLERLKSAGVKIRRTDEEGDIVYLI